MAPEGVADAGARRKIYLDAVRDWVRSGDDSVLVLSAEDVRGSWAGPSAEEARAAACFRLATHLLEIGEVPRARHWLREAAALSPRSWRIKRELWTLGDPGNLFAGDFWDEVDALGAELYYEPPAIEGMPPQVVGRS